MAEIPSSFLPGACAVNMDGPELMRNVFLLARHLKEHHFAGVKPWRGNCLFCIGRLTYGDIPEFLCIFRAKGGVILVCGMAQQSAISRRQKHKNSLWCRRMFVTSFLGFVSDISVEALNLRILNPCSISLLYICNIVRGNGVYSIMYTLRQ